MGVGPGIDGTLTFSQVEMFNRENKSTVVYDVETVSTYSYSGTSWITYDDERSTMVKIAYVEALGLRGYFFWAVNGDLDWKIPRIGEILFMHDLTIIRGLNAKPFLFLIQLMQNHFM